MNTRKHIKTKKHYKFMLMCLCFFGRLNGRFGLCSAKSGDQIRKGGTCGASESFSFTVRIAAVAHVHRVPSARGFPTKGPI